MSGRLIEQCLMDKYGNKTVATLVESSSKWCTAVIIDPRYDELMRAVIRNHIEMLPKWHFVIETAPCYVESAMADFPGAEVRALSDKYLDEAGTNMSINQYNSLLLSADFWTSFLEAEFILIFQKDCIMFKPLLIDQFRSFDFCGANWYNPMHITLRSGGVCGGFSLRRRRAMIDCLRFISWELINNYRENQGRMWPMMTTNEDVFFTWACEILGKSMPNGMVRRIFCVEVDYDENTYAHHGWTKSHLEVKQVVHLLRRLKWIPPAELIAEIEGGLAIGNVTLRLQQNV